MEAVHTPVPGSKIQVYAPFPHAVALDADLDIDPTNWRWVHCLTFPLETLHQLQFSRKPYKWICYAIGAVTGMQGDLSLSDDSPDVMDYDDGLPQESVDLYYHTSDEEKRRMFPTDPNIGRTNITSSVATSRRARFRDDILARDERQCTLSNIEETYCEAVHLVAHSKGDVYISNYTQHRSREPNGNDILSDIDDIRNGLFLNSFTHKALGENVAFLKTPNFAMTTSDIDPAAQSDERRYTAHLFSPNDRYGFGDPTLVGSGPRLRVPNTTNEWPPDILFDIVYASAVLCHFSTPTLKDVLSKSWKDSFYPGGVMTAAQVDYKEITDERAAARERKEKQAQDRRARHEAHRGPDVFDMLMILPYVKVPRDQLEAVYSEARKKAETIEHRRAEEKVNTWAKQVASECP